MAKKVRCRQCGAKNAVDLPRCRICGTVIAEEVVVGPAAAEAAGDLDPGVPRPLPDSGAGIEYENRPRNPSAEFLTIEPEAHYDTDQVERPWTLDAPPAPSREDPVVPDAEHFELEDLDINMHIYRKPPGPAVLSEEGFQPGDFEVVKPPPPPPPPPLKEHFDLDGLEVGVPRDPRPSS